MVSKCEVVDTKNWRINGSLEQNSQLSSILVSGKDGRGNSRPYRIHGIAGRSRLFTASFSKAWGQHTEWHSAGGGRLWKAEQSQYAISKNPQCEGSFSNFLHSSTQSSLALPSPSSCWRVTRSTHSSKWCLYGAQWLELAHSMQQEKPPRQRNRSKILQLNRAAHAETFSISPS